MRLIRESSGVNGAGRNIGNTKQEGQGSDDEAKAHPCKQSYERNANNMRDCRDWGRDGGHGIQESYLRSTDMHRTPIDHVHRVEFAFKGPIPHERQNAGLAARIVGTAAASRSQPPILYLHIIDRVV